MAAVRSKAQLQIGSAQWVSEERENVNRFGDQEVEDFVFAARNEVDWLNEHMAEIFSSNQLNVTEIFKTPGKLRGKTPRTARKGYPLESRAPLTDIFSTNVRPNASPLDEVDISNGVTGFKVSEDLISAPPSEQEPGASRAAKPKSDSGYHGMTEDEMDIDPIPSTTITTQSKIEDYSYIASQAPVDVLPPAIRPSEDRRTTESSFHSAREDLISKVVTRPSPNRDLPAAIDVDEEHSGEAIQLADAQMNPPEALPAEAKDVAAMQGEQIEKDSVLDVDPAIDESRSSLEGSSPMRPLVRKSSLTFASLPAREPLTTKMSIGARISRTSHLDQSKPNLLNRGSVLGRFTGGKSLGGTRQQLQDDELRMDKDGEVAHEGHNVEDVEMLNEERPALTREESDGDAKITKLHNKSSTQRLHERINMLGQSQPARPTKSIPASVTVAVQPSYPELAHSDIGEVQSLEQSNAPLPKSNTTHPIDDDEDDWIKPPPALSTELKRPHDVTEISSEKGSINGNASGLGPYERYAIKELSPPKQLTVVDKLPNGLGHIKSASASNLNSPLRVTASKETNHKMASSVSNPVLSSLTEREKLAQPSTTPAGSPASRRHVDGPLSASKSKLQSIMKTARGLFSSSAGVSAQAKMETFSPQSMRTRGPAQGLIDSTHADVGLYPDLQSARQAMSFVSELPGNPLKKGDAPRTRSSTEKEDKRREKEDKKKGHVDNELERAREMERQRSTKYRDELNKIANMKTPASEQEQVPESTKSEPPQPQPATRKSPRRLQNKGESTSHVESLRDSSIDAVQGEIAESTSAPPPRMQTQHSQIQRPKELRRPTKPAKEAVAKPKPQPVAIRVGTLSQRIPLTNTVLSSSLQESLPPPQSHQPGLVKKASNASLQTSASGHSLKTSVSSTSTKPKALLAAERKKEQDEKEAQRKMDQKRDIERKRAAQQKEARKQEQQQRQEMERQREQERAAAAEDPRKVAQKQAIEKRRLELGKKDQQRNAQRLTNDAANTVQRPPSRPVQDSNRPAPNFPAPNPAKPPTKRVFEPDNEDEHMKPTRVQGGPSYQQADAKRRRTNDEDLQDLPVRPTMAPPIRQSNIRPKDAPKHSIFSNGYTNAPSANTAHHVPPLMKAPTMNQAYHQHQQHQYHNPPPRPANALDMAKYTSGKIPFAENPNPAQPSHKTPLPSKKGATHAAKSSPHYINPDNIDLAEIPTDSEEDSDSEADNKKQSLMASWVQSPALREQLRAQEDAVDAEAVFGPIAPLNMEEIFDKSRHHRFRSRTSSANWTGQDRLTEEEVRMDLAARERLRREGGWTYGL